MKTRKLRRTRRTSARACARCALAARNAGVRRRVPVATSNSGSGLGNAYAGARRSPRTRRRCGGTRRRCRGSRRIRARPRSHIITPSIKFSNDGSLPALNQPLGGDGGDAGGDNFVPNMYIVRADQSAVGVRPRRQRAVRPDDRVRRRLARPLPGAQVADQDDQRESRARRGRSTPSSRSAPASTTRASRPRCHQQRQLFGRAAAGRRTAAAGIAPGRRPFNAIARRRRRSIRRRRSPATTGPGAGTSALAWDVDAAAARRRALSLGDQVQRERQRRLRQPDACRRRRHARPRSADHCAARRRRQQRRRCTTAASRPTSSCRRSPTCRCSTGINPQWEVMADVQWTGWSSIEELTFVAQRPGRALPAMPLRIRDDTWQVSRSARAIASTTSGSARFGVAFDQTPVNDTDRTPRLPDSDRWWLAIGGEYKWTPNLQVRRRLRLHLRRQPGDSTRTRAARPAMA